MAQQYLIFFQLLNFVGETGEFGLLNREWSQQDETLVGLAGTTAANPPADQTLRVRYAQLQAIMDSTRDAVLLFDRRGRLLQFNPVAQELLERPLAPYVGQSFFRWLRENDSPHLQATTGLNLYQLRQYVLDILRDPTRPVRRQFQHTRGERVMYLSETGSPVLDQSGRLTGWLVVWRDYTEERQLDMMRQEISSMVVHDLRNPLTSIISGMGMLRDLLHEDQMDHAALLEVVQIAQNSAENMLNLVQSLLDISRLEQSKFVLDCESSPLSDPINHASSVVLSLAMIANIDMALDVPDDLPPIWMDDEKIERVLVNLLDNALRHTPYGGQVKITAHYPTTNKMVTISVADSGPGIPPQARERVFDKFVQLDPQRVLRGHKGSGLGLTFCKLVVEAHGGRIWVEDSALGGAAFHFTLPVAHMHGVLFSEPE